MLNIIKEKDNFQILFEEKQAELELLKAEYQDFKGVSLIRL